MRGMQSFGKEDSGRACLVPATDGPTVLRGFINHNKVSKICF